jgi:hypothetical protein
MYTLVLIRYRTEASTEPNKGMCVCVRACACVCVCVRVRVRVRVCVYACRDIYILVLIRRITQGQIPSQTRANLVPLRRRGAK